MKHPDARSGACWLTCLAVAAWATACAESGALRGYRWVGVGVTPARANAGGRELCEAVAEVIAQSDLPHPLVQPCGAGEVKRAIATRNPRVLTEEADSVWLVFDADGA